MNALLDALRVDGFILLRDVGPDGFERVLEELGDVVLRTPVELRADVSTYVCQPGAVPLHTDHPDVDIVGWCCERQDEHDGASLLVDTRRILAGFDESTRERLSEVLLPCPALRAVTTAAHATLRALLSAADEIYFAEWLAPNEPSALDLWRTFAKAVAQAPCHAFRLTPGDVLLVDNHRMLHGRGPLRPSSMRRLRRAWVVT